MTVIPDINDDELAQCVGCGLCLPHCPTYRVTQDERQSPRGRIALMRDWIAAGEVDTESLESLDSCIQCVGCESACPSGVQYGHLIASTRAAMNDGPSRAHLLLRLGLGVLRHPRILRFGSLLIAVAQRVHLVPARLGVPTLPLRQPRVNIRRVASRDTSLIRDDHAWFFRGCVMDAWSRDVHVASVQVLRAAGVTVVQPEGDTVCCGALHHHAGLNDTAHKMAELVMESFPGDVPIVVNSAGCGAMLKQYGEMLGTAEARAFSSRVFDIHEFLGQPSRLAVLASNVGDRSKGRVIVQDPCHLRHAQRVHQSVRDVLALVATPVDIPDDGLCCGAGGSYFLTHREMAGELRDRKIAHINAIVSREEEVVVSANPGCAIHLSNGGAHVEHPMVFMARHVSIGESNSEKSRQLPERKQP